VIRGRDKFLPPGATATPDISSTPNCKKFDPVFFSLCQFQIYHRAHYIGAVAPTSRGCDIEISFYR
jgi:hypothetical protein